MNSEGRNVGLRFGGGLRYVLAILGLESGASLLGDINIETTVSMEFREILNLPEVLFFTRARTVYHFNYFITLLDKCCNTAKL